MSSARFQGVFPRLSTPSPTRDAGADARRRRSTRGDEFLSPLARARAMRARAHRLGA